MTTDEFKTQNAPYKLRGFVSSDTDGILRLFRSSVYSLCAKDYSPRQLEAWASCADKARWQAQFSARHTTVATADGIIVGFCDCENNGHIDRLYVLPGYEGNGIGKALVYDAESSHNCTVTTVEASLTAKPFFEKLGYTADRKQSVLRNGEYLENYKMFKKMSDPS